MKQIKENIVKGIITSLVGVATMVITLFLVFMGQMDFMWNGVLGLSIGCVLLLAPKTIEKKFSDIFGKVSSDVPGKKDDANQLDDQKPE